MHYARLITRSAPALVWVLVVIVSNGGYAQEAPGKPDALKLAQQALKNGSDNAADLATVALKEDSKDAARNLLVSLALFWKGRFKDAPRYMRRAMAADQTVVLTSDTPADLMPASDFRDRLNELAELAEGNVEACFLTGALLAMDDDVSRATAFLIRAEELAGTDGQAERIRKPDATTRNLENAKLSLSESKFDEAALSLMLTLFEFPDQPLARAMLAICMAGNDHYDMAAKILAGLQKVSDPDGLLESVIALNAPADDLRIVAKTLYNKDETLPRLRLGALVAFSIGYYTTAREIALLGLIVNQLDAICFDVRDYMERKKLVGDPDTKEPDPVPIEPEPSSLQDIKKLVQKTEYKSALEQLLEYTGTEPEAFLLVYVAGAGAARYKAASKGVQHWIEKLNPERPFELNLIREVFSQSETFDKWVLDLEVTLRANPDDPDVRLMHAFSECTRGNYAQARDDLEIAAVSLADNKAIQILTKYLKRPEFEDDSMPGVVKEPPPPATLHLEGLEAFKSGDFKLAMEKFASAAEGDPDLAGISKSLIRGSFALGEYHNAMRYMRALFKEQDLLQKGVSSFSFRAGTGYSGTTIYENHLDALRDAAKDAFIGDDEWALLGSIEFGRRNWKNARNALQNWKDKTTNKVLDPILLQMLEHAKKKSE
ncbi:MAG: hypothetical protein ACYTDT_04750 [Planctomycetota bacterium]|jgi:hypothetical protein